MISVFLRYPEGRAKAVTFSYDDGVGQDKRLAETFDKYGMKATFNFCASYSRDWGFSDEEIEEIFLSKGHEIAVHGAFHRANGNTRPIEGIRDVLDCRMDLEKRCKRIIRGMAYPDTGIRVMGNFGTYEGIKNYLKELDIVYARTLGGDNKEFRLPDDFHAWMPSVHHSNPQVMEYVDEFIKIDTSTNTYHARRYPRLLYIWGHSYEFDNHNNWELIEEICQKLSGREDYWYATNIEIYDYVEAYKRLVFSADGCRIYNPTLIDLWIDVDGKLYSIKSGETVLIV